MPLQAVHEKIDDIPEQYRDLYTEKGGKFELTGITGVKTQADVDRLQAALTKEREEHKNAKNALGIWGDLKHEEVVAQLDKIPELEAAAKGKLDEAQIEEIVNRRVDGTIKSRTAPLERQLKAATDTIALLKTDNEKLTGEKRSRFIGDDVRSELIKNKVIPEAHDDALMIADRIFEIPEEGGRPVTKEGVGVTPGITADIWLQEMQPKRPHWWPLSAGGGATGGGRDGGNFMGGNPFSAEHWDVTKQGQIVRTQGREKAEQMAKAAGTTVGGLKPKPRK